MKTISVAVSEEDYEAFRHAARREHRPIAQLIREAMAHYRADRWGRRSPLNRLPTFPEARLRPGSELPTRSAIYDEAASRHFADRD
jgi:hypothetical protein